ncbi:MAG: TraB/GumN family protein, partial [Candidatus Cloacimonetes bacterium]|nr:TraB/GumN family protein [Candidatus Cloacimonadota bacterium]
VVALLGFVFLSTTLNCTDNFLWEVENGNNKVYLLGSLHIMPKEVYPLDDRIEEAFEEADILVVEVDATTLDQEKVQAFIIENACYAEANNLQKELPEDLYKSVEEKFAELGVTMDKINIYKPWFVSLTLGLSGLSKLDIKPGLGIDLHFLNKAHEKEMEIVELETATSQLEMLASFPEDIQNDYLQYTLDDYENSNELFMNMLEAWKSGDTDEMNTITKVKMLELEDELPGITGYYNRMFTERDEKILVKIEKLLNNEEKKVYFIIIGAFHLVGEDGLIKLLNAKGYNTKQL